MKSFSSFLRGKCRVPDKKVPFYMHWVSRYHAFNSSCSAGNYDQIKPFLETLSLKQEDWQVRQAERAVSLYLYFKKSGYSGNTGTHIPGPQKIPSEWSTVMEELVRLLRLRHRSYRTEKTYVNWTKRFSIYLNHESAPHV